MNIIVIRKMATAVTSKQIPAQLIDCLLHRPTVEPRSPCFHVKPGREEEFADLFRASRFGEHFALLSIDEAASLRLFGPHFSSRARELAGSFIALTPERRALVYRRPMKMIGMHGGMTRAEVQVPFIVVGDHDDDNGNSRQAKL